MIRQFTLLDRVLFTLTRKRRYRCRFCESFFLAPDRRKIKRPE